MSSIASDGWGSSDSTCMTGPVEVRRAFTRFYREDVQIRAVLPGAQTCRHGEERTAVRVDRFLTFDYSMADHATESGRIRRRRLQAGSRGGERGTRSSGVNPRLRRGRAALSALTRQLTSQAPERGHSIPRAGPGSMPSGPVYFRSRQSEVRRNAANARSLSVLQPASRYLLGYVGTVLRMPGLRLYR